MQRRDITLDEGKCLLEFLKEEGERIEHSQIFLSSTIVYQLKKDAKFGSINGKLLELDMGAEYENPKISIRLFAQTNDRHPEWYELIGADISGIHFTVPANAPEEVYFIKN